MLRLLALKYDIAAPHLRQMLMAFLYGLTNEKCRDFQATVSRIVHVDKICNDMVGQCGERPGDAVFGNIFYPSMDLSLITELVHYRIGKGASALPIDSLACMGEC